MFCVETRVLYPAGLQQRHNSFAYYMAQMGLLHSTMTLDVQLAKPPNGDLENEGQLGRYAVSINYHYEYWLDTW